MKKFFLCVWLIGAAPFYLAAQQKVTVSHHVADAAHTGDQGILTERVYLQYKTTPQVKLINIQTEKVDKLPPGTIKSTSFEADVLRSTERKKPVAIIKFPAYRVSGDKIEKLVSYDLEITEYDDGTSGPTSRKPTDVPHSVLASGSWYKIAVPSRGIYKIDYAFLQNLGVNPSSINPANIRVYGNGGTVLPERVSGNQPDDLIENAIVVNSSGSSFGQNDYILFYANGPVLWSKDSLSKTFRHTSNYYENQSYYFLNFDIGPGKRIASEPASGTSSYNVTAFDDYALIEGDSVNLGGIGKTWWAYKMNSVNSASLIQAMNVNLGPVSGPNVKITTNVGNINIAGGNTVEVKFNGTTIKNFTLDQAPLNYLLVATSGETLTAPAPSGSGTSTLQYRYYYNGPGSAYVDFARFNYRRLPIFPGGQLAFRDWETAGLPAGQNAAYSLQNANASLQVWDITDPLQPINLQGSLSGSTYTFTRAGNSLKEFISFDGTQFGVPTAIGTVPNQDLHGLGPTDFLIVTPAIFKAAADDLAEFHRQKDNMRVTVATLDQIYNEFSSGGQDIGGIRNFIKMFYDRADNDEEMIKNVLFMGAASYDYKGRLTFNTNFTPTYETAASEVSTSAYASDDYFALLDENESITGNDQLDIGTGRIPALDATEAQNAVNKIKNYVSPASFGPWKNIVTYVADDKDNPASENGTIDHLQDCEKVNQYFYDSLQVFNLHKLYADAYSQINTPAGGRYPMVNKAINDQIYNGTFLVSYSGHGSPDRWAHEAILTADDYGAWRNKNKLPVMITATCDFGRFDDPNHRSAGSKLSINPEGGSIAMITTTQLVYANQNTDLNRLYTRAQLSKKPDGNWRTLGEALYVAKNSYATDNNHKYVVLGDPALKMAMPVHNVVTDKLKIMDSETETDTVRALGRYTLTGFIKDNAGNVLTSFNGPVYVTVFDKKRKVLTVNPDPDASRSFMLQTNVVAKVKGTVVNGAFSVSFIVPKDINYDYGHGKISYYANSDVTDASGLDSSFTVGGYNDNAGEDNDAPIVQPYIDNDKFRNGGVTGPNPLLYVKLYDDNGINISGSSVGHDLVGILDDDVQNPFIMNNYYTTEQNDYRKGYVNFPLYNLPEGIHTLRVKAWDAYNNSGEGTVVFEVRNKDKGFISDLYNYPNPMKEITHFVFQHNQEGEQMDVTLTIYTAAGRLVKTIKQNLETTGNRTEITWDGLGEGGAPLSKGVYFYRLQAKTSKGVTATAYQKLVLLR
jgi:hypothetical protein